MVFIIFSQRRSGHKALKLQLMTALLSVNHFINHFINSFINPFIISYQFFDYLFLFIKKMNLS